VNSPRDENADPPHADPPIRFPADPFPLRHNYLSQDVHDELDDACDRIWLKL
jgi:hypothetical protein